MKTGRTLAIGDIHGTLRALDALLRVVDPRLEDTVVFLGDYVNRGLDTAGVLDRLLEVRERCRMVALLGNHDAMMLRACRASSRARREAWLSMGGQSTLDSYPDGAFASIPERHLRFLESCRLVHEDEARIYAHGGVEADVPVAEQRPEVVLWQRVGEARPHMSGKLVVCGHSVQKSGVPLHVGHTICVDTGAASGGWLTCLSVETERYWQCTETGEVREGVLRRLPERRGREGPGVPPE